jgi:hypothetical protein
MAGAGLVGILTVCLSMYGSVIFDSEPQPAAKKTLSGRDLPPDALQSKDGCADCSALRHPSLASVVFQPLWKRRFWGACHGSCDLSQWSALNGSHLLCL